MTNKEYYQSQASQAAKRDFGSGLSADASRHGALKNSAWAIAYTRAYEALQLQSPLSCKHQYLTKRH